MANDDLFAALMRFHQEVALPDMQRLVREPLEEQISTLRTELRSEMLSGFDGGYKRIERIESEMTSVRGGMNRLEEKLASLEQRIAGIDLKLDQFAVKAELGELEERVDEMQQRIEQLKSMLNEH